ncbi:Methyltransferase family protein [Elusimicrobium minutum Pei191]|uniref:Methyltransferase family protein n=1 Tax=Elusimicrobium minutum (strain Pei191) TaxID=445932 RepID=B2KB51_ELUMP|nr:class I SAM-dependent methyltransferase [Elusimicrobium minutum]ACC97810.1 Methyltransferase family protein [Elusimicrobium minutum Pei191]
MDKKQIAAFFDSIACGWDAKERSEVYAKIEQILAKCEITQKAKILDIGCGTGVLFPFLSKYNPGEILSIDLSSKMLEEFKRKHPEANALLADFEDIKLEEDYYDNIIAYNVFPHFVNKEAVFYNAFKFLKHGGIFVVAHSMTREELNSMHGRKKETSKDLLPSSEQMKYFYASAGFKQVIVQEKAPGFFSKGVKI